MTGNQGQITIVLVCYNKVRYTRLCLQSLLRLAYRPLKLVIVNNGSTDATASLLENFQPVAAAAGIETKVLSFVQNIGAIASRNHALDEVSGEGVLFLDNDVIIRSVDLIEQLTSFLSRSPQVGAVGPKLVYPRPPYLIQSAGGMVTREGITYLVGRGEERIRIEHNLIVSRPWLISACLMVPTRVIREVGKFDMAFHPIFFEDVDYCCRIRVKGYQVIYFPGAEIYHFENITTNGGRSQALNGVVRRNQRVFWRKWRHLFQDSHSIDEIPWVWKHIPRVPIEEAHDLEIICGRGT